jgi:hypothetical protein
MKQTLRITLISENKTCNSKVTLSRGPEVGGTRAQVSALPGTNVERHQARKPHALGARAKNFTQDQLLPRTCQIASSLRTSSSLPRNETSLPTQNSPSPQNLGIPEQLALNSRRRIREIPHDRDTQIALTVAVASENTSPFRSSGLCQSPTPPTAMHL